MTEHPTPSPSSRILVLGIGNILWADEGFGVRAVEAFHRAYQADDNVTVMDGGTQGLYLVNLLQEHDHLLVFDAIDYGLVPGTLRRIDGDEVPKFTGAKKMSLHQTGFQEVLSAADLLGAAPARLALIGCQPQDLEDWGGALTPPVAARIDDALALARTILAEWGVMLTPRDAALTPAAPLLSHDLDHASYERRAAPAAAVGN
ncbi:HyaD/HybD family hydrogenase maturation endopeptidase [Rhodopseudomonas palustris]|uniref:HyaD/HybD family hydrogenase maturation endopeptidase n=1 Tax=Rhodopseudomonas palustris TaxID=1076 RepID=UPI0020CEA3AE|nr:HyaD/HybD family hydrogenase maturation endopeptidase [Rhodopseudomonas palustris]MCP9628841.1 HyaD/HybD family hydrogenase maturation endopeptidase [Rhodopseudomonas palustris]